MPTTDAPEPEGPVPDFLASKSGSSPRTIRTYAMTLRSYERWNGSPSISQNQYDRYILHLAKQHHRPNGIAHSATVLRQYAQFLGIDTARWQKPRWRQPPVVPLKLNEVQMLRNACSQLRHPEQARFVLGVLLTTGIRVGELVRLLWSDVDLIDNTMVIRESKGGKSRTIRLSADAILCFCRWARHRLGFRWTPEKLRLTPDPVLPVRTTMGVEKIVHSIAQKAGLSIRGIHPHLLRHTHAIAVLRSKSVDIRTLQKSLGHSSLETTARYLQLTDLDTTEEFSQVHLFPDTSMESGPNSPRDTVHDGERENDEALSTGTTIP